MSRITVLVTSAGTASAVTVLRALKLRGVPRVTTVAIDADRTAPGLYLADTARTVPRHGEATFWPALLDVCHRCGVDAILPTHSGEIALFASRRQELEHIGIRTLLPDQSVVTLCGDKARMYAYAARLGIPVPRMYESGDVLKFPLVIKPRSGSGSKGFRVISLAREMPESDVDPDKMVLEFVEGPEATVDIVADRSHSLVAASPRWRLETKAGQSTKAVTFCDDELTEHCRVLVSNLRFVGPANIQFIRRNGRFVFIEMNPRFAAGGLGLTVRAGANLPRIAVRIMLGLSIERKKIEEGLMMVRYWSDIYLRKGDLL